jgi:hypothetical protein
MLPNWNKHFSSKSPNNFLLFVSRQGLHEYDVSGRGRAKAKSKLATFGFLVFLFENERKLLPLPTPFQEILLGNKNSSKKVTLAKRIIIINGEHETITAGF